MQVKMAENEHAVKRLSKAVADLEAENAALSAGRAAWSPTSTIDTQWRASDAASPSISPTDTFKVLPAIG